MRWLIRQLTNRNSGWWKLYEVVSPYIVFLFFGFLFGVFTGIASVIIKMWLGDHPYHELILHWMGIYSPFFVGCLTCVMLIDLAKFRLTGDPRDKPGRKWWSREYAQRFLPNEVILMPGDHIVRVSEAADLQIAVMSITNCSKCDVTHAFGVEETAPRTCLLYGCGATVPRSET